MAALSREATILLNVQFASTDEFARALFARVIAAIATAPEFVYR